MESNMFPKGNNPREWSWRRNLGVLLLIVGAVALLILIFRAARRGGAGVLMAAALPVAASIATATRPTIQTGINERRLERSLEEIALKTPRLTPTELLERLQAYEIEFSSLQQMGRVLAEYGLESQTDYVSGRSERRWYRLDRWRADESV